MKIILIAIQMRTRKSKKKNANKSSCLS